MWYRREPDWFIFSQFTDSFSNSHSISVNDNWKWHGIGRSWPTAKHYIIICLVGLGNTHEESQTGKSVSQLRF